MSLLSLSTEEQQALRSNSPLLWLNPRLGDQNASPSQPALAGIDDAEARLLRFAPLLSDLFPELRASEGLIESPLLETSFLNETIDTKGGRLLLKADHSLPVAGSIKARGGIHEVLCLAEELALQAQLISSTTDDYRKLGRDAARQLFASHNLAVGSTGNLGLSIGIIGAALGFSTSVHMSSDAKEWKKQRLRNRGVTVVEHDADYGAAVAAGRAQSDANPRSYFVDDENSPRLFMGYAVAARRLQQQLESARIPVDAAHPLFVYLPAGVGGAPGGITFGLKQLFGEHVHCFFAEPTQAPCMMLGLAGEPGSTPIPVYDFGLSIATDADGLAVGTAAQWVCDSVRHQVSGVYTVADHSLYRSLLALKERENIEVEPSAAAGCSGPAMLNTDAGQRYLQQQGLIGQENRITHLIWTTGGSLVPEQEYQHYLEQAIKNTI
ncbi:D-serine ammonia-lyase [Marinobacterium jannaschii]|uniref:D-serine ammonia-lyase n=1 Tax=Marinobacterium jannaschii TaxID=64970 RepID=UPI0004886101|nr:D-serine ammonia-lyase [Marinobacterium jannaschii]